MYFRSHRAEVVFHQPTALRLSIVVECDQASCFLDVAPFWFSVWII